MRNVYLEYIENFCKKKYEVKNVIKIVKMQKATSKKLLQTKKKL